MNTRQDTHTDNGRVPDDPYSDAAARALSDITNQSESLRGLLDAERALGDQLRALLRASDARAERLNAAITALTGSAPKRKPGPRPHGEDRGNMSGGTTVGRPTLESVLGWIRAAPRPVTNKELAEALGITVHTANAATNALRKQELIRRAGGSGGPGGGFTYAPMPSSADAAPQASKAAYRPAARTIETRKRIVDYARKHDTFLAHEAAAALGMDARGIGPLMRALADAGELEVVGSERLPRSSVERRRYRLGEGA